MTKLLTSYEASVARSPELIPPSVRTTLELRRLLAGRKFAQLEGELLAVLGEESTAVYNYESTMRGVSSWEQLAAIPSFLKSYMSEFPESFFARHLTGQWYASWAWEARSGKTADLVGAKQFELFHSRLEIAESLLHEALKLVDKRGPDFKGAAVAFCAICSALLPVMYGLEYPQEEIQSFFQSLISGRMKAGVLQIRLWDCMLNACAMKWGGSHESMFAIARAALQMAPIGHPLCSTIASAHAERKLACLMEEPPEDELHRTYYALPEVRTEILSAYLRFIGKDKESDLSFPETPDSYAHRDASALFAISLWQIWRSSEPRDPQIAEYARTEMRKTISALTLPGWGKAAFITQLSGQKLVNAFSSELNFKF